MATIEIPLTQGKVAIVDEQDVPILVPYKWRIRPINRTIYAIAWSATRPRYAVIMHRLILGVTDPRQDVDHRDGNGLNNSRSNIRLATYSQNGHNYVGVRGVSPYRGVFRTDRGKAWESRIRCNGTRVSLGRFESDEDAARAYDAAAREFFGDFARLNFPKVGELGCRSHDNT